MVFPSMDINIVDGFAWLVTKKRPNDGFCN